MARAGEHDLEQDDGHAPAGVFSFRFFTLCESTVIESISNIYNNILAGRRSQRAGAARAGIFAVYCLGVPYGNDAVFLF